MLSETQIKQYKEEGFVLVEEAIDRETLAELRRVTDEIVASSVGVAEHTSVLDLDSSHTPENPRVRRIKHPFFAHPFYQQLARHAGILDAIAPLIGEGIRLLTGGKINLKLEADGAAIEWHQDWAFYPHTNQDLLAIGLMLDDVDLDNGPLLAIPGSHQGPIYDHHNDGVFCGAIDTVKSGLDVTSAKPLVGTAGSMTIHHVRLVHGSAVNKSNRARRMLFYMYAATDAWPLKGVTDLDEFDRMIMRGSASHNPRMESLPVRIPLPIAPNQGSIYENQRTLKNRYFDS